MMSKRLFGCPPHPHSRVPTPEFQELLSSEETWVLTPILPELPAPAPTPPPPASPTRCSMRLTGAVFLR